MYTCVAQSLRAIGACSENGRNNDFDLLSAMVTQTLVTSLVQSCTDDCDSLLTELPQCLLDTLQRVQNRSARLMFKSTKRTLVSPLLSRLHWHPIAQRIKYKVSSICYSVVLGTAPPHVLTYRNCTNRPDLCAPQLIVVLSEFP